MQNQVFTTEVGWQYMGTAHVKKIRKKGQQMEWGCCVMELIRCECDVLVCSVGS